MGLFLLLSLSLSASSPQHKPSSNHRFFSHEHQQRQFQFVPELFRQLPAPNDHDFAAPLALQYPHHQAAPKRTYAAVVSYYGPNFPGGYDATSIADLPTVRGTLTAAIEETLEESGMDEHRIRLQTAGRTDALVSAKANVFSFVSRGRKMPFWDEDDLGEFRGNLNRRLQNKGMQVTLLQRVNDRFHATFSTTSRQYLYVLPLSKNVGSQEAQRYAAALQATLQAVAVGVELDFKAVSSGVIRTQDSFCTLQSVTVSYWNHHQEAAALLGQDPILDKDPVPGFSKAWETATLLHGDNTNNYPHCLFFAIRSNRFLKRMMRKLINGILIDHEKENDTGLAADVAENHFRSRLASLDRSGNHPAPAEGLCLWRVWHS